MRKRADVHTTSCATNAETNVNRVSERRLFVARNITPKEVSNPHLKATNFTIRVKSKNYTRLKLKRRIKSKIAVFGTLFIQKNKVLLPQGKNKSKSESQPYKYINKYIVLLSEKKNY